MIIIIAGNSWQAMDWMRRNSVPPHVCRVINTPDQLRGIRLSQPIVYAGEYWKNPAYKSHEVERIEEIYMLECQQ